jgi:hypothetical protein
MLLITVATTAFPFSRPFGLHLLRAHQHDGVAVDDPATRVNEDGAIPVAVVRDPQAILSLRHERGEQLRGRRAAVQIDISTIGLAADAPHIEAEVLKQPRRHGRRRSVRAVDGDAHAAEARGLRQNAFQVDDVVVPIVDLLDRFRVGNRSRP